MKPTNCLFSYLFNSTFVTFLTTWKLPLYSANIPISTFPVVDSTPTKYTSNVSSTCEARDMSWMMVLLSIWPCSLGEDVRNANPTGKRKKRLLHHGIWLLRTSRHNWFPAVLSVRNPAGRYSSIFAACCQLQLYVIVRYFAPQIGGRLSIADCGTKRIGIKRSGYNLPFKEIELPIIGRIGNWVSVGSWNTQNISNLATSCQLQIQKILENSSWRFNWQLSAGFHLTISATSGRKFVSCWNIIELTTVLWSWLPTARWRISNCKLATAKPHDIYTDIS